MTDDDLVVLLFPRLELPEPEPTVSPIPSAANGSSPDWLAAFGAQVDFEMRDFRAQIFRDAFLAAPRAPAPDTIEFPVRADVEVSTDASPEQVRSGIIGIDYAATERRVVAHYADLANLPPEQIEQIRVSVADFMRSLRDQTPVLIDSLSQMQELFGNPRTWSGVGQAFRGLSGLLHDAEAAVPSSVSEAFREAEPDPTAYREGMDSQRIGIVRTNGSLDAATLYEVYAALNEEGEVVLHTVPEEDRVHVRRLSSMIQADLDDIRHPGREHLTVCYGHSKRHDYLDNVPMTLLDRDPGGDQICGRVHRPSIAAQERRDRSRFANYGAKGLPKSGVREYRRRRR